MPFKLDIVRRNVSRGAWLPRDFELSSPSSTKSTVGVTGANASTPLLYLATCFCAPFYAGIAAPLCCVPQAYGDSSPIVVLPGGYPRRLMNVRPNFNAFLNYQHVTKWCEQVVVAEAVPDAMRRAFTQVRNGRPRGSRDGIATGKTISSNSRRWVDVARAPALGIHRICTSRSRARA